MVTEYFSAIECDKSIREVTTNLSSFFLTSSDFFAQCFDRIRHSGAPMENSLWPVSDLLHGRFVQWFPPSGIIVPCRRKSFIQGRWAPWISDQSIEFLLIVRWSIEWKKIMMQRDLPTMNIYLSCFKMRNSSASYVTIKNFCPHCMKVHFSVLFVLFFTVWSLVIFRSICSINHITFVNTTATVVASSTEHEAITVADPAERRNAQDT